MRCWRRRRWWGDRHVCTVVRDRVMLSRAGLDERFVRLVIGTIVLSEVIVLASNAAYRISKGHDVSVGIGEMLFVSVPLFGALSVLVFALTIGPAAVVWAFYWKLGGLAGLSVRVRAVICACFTVPVTSMLLALFFTTSLGRSFAPFLFILVWVFLLGGPVALVVAPALAAIIYRERGRLRPSPQPLNS